MPNSTKSARTFDMTLDINASTDDVWRALTDATELVRWFPLQARVTRGAGGKVLWSWGGNWEWESDIEAWEPGHRLRLTERRPAFDASGQPLPGEPQPMAMEFTIETHMGQTRLKLVHSGFGEGATWDDELDSVSGGWQLELRALRLYLERHRGRDRHASFASAVTSLDQPTVWARMLSPDAFAVEGGPLALGEHRVIRTALGDTFSGSVAWLRPGQDLLLTVDELNGGTFRISTWQAGGQTGVQAWLAAWEPAFAERVRAFQPRAAAIITQQLERLDA